MKFTTIMADPPWPYETPGQIGKTLAHRPNRDKGLSKHGAGSVARYGSLSIESICALPVAAIVANDAHLYLCVTNTFMEQAYVVARAWGFRPVLPLTWTKVKANGEPSMKMGYYYRGATEHVLFCVRGRLRLRGPAESTALITKRLNHSTKPEALYQRIEVQSPGPYLEMFARRSRTGWAAWGNEVDSDVGLA